MFIRSLKGSSCLLHHREPAVSSGFLQMAPDDALPGLPLQPQVCLSPSTLWKPMAPEISDAGGLLRKGHVIHEIIIKWRLVNLCMRDFGKSDWIIQDHHLSINSVWSAAVVPTDYTLLFICQTLAVAMTNRAAYLLATNDARQLELSAAQCPSILGGRWHQ